MSDSGSNALGDALQGKRLAHPPHTATDDFALHSDTFALPSRRPSRRGEAGGQASRATNGSRLKATPASPGCPHPTNGGTNPNKKVEPPDAERRRSEPAFGFAREFASTCAVADPRWRPTGEGRHRHTRCPPRAHSRRTRRNRARSGPTGAGMSLARRFECLPRDTQTPAPQRRLCRPRTCSGASSGLGAAGSVPSSCGAPLGSSSWIRLPGSRGEGRLGTLWSRPACCAVPSLAGRPARNGWPGPAWSRGTPARAGR